MSALTEEGRKELRRFGWTLGGDFERRYAQDAWVFNLANAVERVAAERDEARAALKQSLAFIERENAGDPTLTSEHYYAVRDFCRAALAPVPHEGG